MLVCLCVCVNDCSHLPVCVGVCYVCVRLLVYWSVIQFSVCLCEDI